MVVPMIQLRLQKNPVIVYDLPKLNHGKAEALNKAWIKYAKNAEIVVCADADCEAPKNMVETFIKILSEKPSKNRRVAAVTGSITMSKNNNNIMTSSQYFAQMNIRRLNMIGSDALVLLGNCSAFRGEALQKVAKDIRSDGPWDLYNETEDHKLTYDLRRLGYNLAIAPKINAITQPKLDVKSTFKQMLRWHIGASKNLLRIGIKKYTIDAFAFWWLPEVITSILRLMWLLALVISIIIGANTIVWWVLILVLLILFGYEYMNIYSIKARNRSDIIYKNTIVFIEFSTWIKSIMIVRAVAIAIYDLTTNNNRNRWHEQTRS